jgi:hypothetical protein
MNDSRPLPLALCKRVTSNDVCTKIRHASDIFANNVSFSGALNLKNKITSFDFFSYFSGPSLFLSSKHASGVVARCLYMRKTSYWDWHVLVKTLLPVTHFDKYITGSIN